MQYVIYKSCTCFCETFYFMIFFYSISSRFTIQFSESKKPCRCKNSWNYNYDRLGDSQSKKNAPEVDGTSPPCLKTSTSRTTLLRCLLLWIISSTRKQRWETTQLRPVWSLMQSAEGQQKSTASLNVTNSEIEEVDSFMNLGANVTKDGRVTADIRKKIAVAGPSFRRLDSIWRVNNINRKVKVSIQKPTPLRIVLWIRGMET